MTAQHKLESLLEAADWHSRAACLGLTHFCDRQSEGYAPALAWTNAECSRVCARCPVITQCVLDKSTPGPWLNAQDHDGNGSWTAPQLAKALGIHPNNVTLRARQGRLPGARKHRGQWRIPAPVARLVAETGMVPEHHHSITEEDPEWWGPYDQPEHDESDEKSEDDMPNPWVTPGALAQEIGLNPATVYRAITHGTIKANKLHEKQYVIEESEVRRVKELYRRHLTWWTSSQLAKAAGKKYKCGVNTGIKRAVLAGVPGICHAPVGDGRWGWLVRPDQAEHWLAHGAFAESTTKNDHPKSSQKETF